jgi:hypothetical protein
MASKLTGLGDTLVSMGTRNEALIEWRESQLLSQGELARMVRDAGERAGEPNDCTIRLVQRWEAGEVAAPRGNYARALEAISGRSVESLGFRLGRDMSRREAVGAAAFLALPVIEGKARGPLTGIWKSRYEYPSSSRGKTFTSEHTVTVLQHGARVQVRSIAGEGQVSMDLSVDGTTVTGTWNEITSADGYYRGARYSGAIQLLVEPSGHRMAGRWVGYGRSFDVNTGPWQLDLVTADVSRESVRRHGE